MSLELEREQAIQALCAHYAREHLTTGELEARFERTYRAKDSAELRTVLAGLPALPTAPSVPAPLYQLAATGALPVGEKRYLAVFSQVKKEGAWTPAPLIRGKVIMGGLILDLREAEIPLGGIDVDLDVIMGECRILLPPGVGATVDVTAVLAEASDKAQRALPDAPMVRVRGAVIMGEVTVQTKLPKPARLESWRAQVRALLGGRGRDG